MKRSLKLATICFSIFVFFLSNTLAQSTEFTFQGSLDVASSPANGNYDFEFALFDAASGGTQHGSIVTRSNVSVVNGVFSVNLDFGTQFPGTPRFLRIGVKTAGGGSFTILSPRQQLRSVPYAIRSLSALIATTANDSDELGGIDAGQYVLTTDQRMIDQRNPLPGSGNYIQNSGIQQASSNFNISGIGTASSFNASTRYNIRGEPILSNPGTGNTFAGVGTGAALTTGFNNSFFGKDSGATNATGSDNSFFGQVAGFGNTSGVRNSFFGKAAGTANATGSDNSFVGTTAGASNFDGNENSFFGKAAGFSNTSGNRNSFFGKDAGFSNTDGFDNSFFGSNSGTLNESISNSFFGRSSGANNTLGSSNSFFGSHAGFSSSFGHNNSFFGSAAGRDNTDGGRNAFFGNGAGADNTEGFGNTFIGSVSGFGNVSGDKNSALGYESDVGSPGLIYATAIGAEAVVVSSHTIQLGRRTAQDAVVISGTLRIGNLGSAGATTLCRNASFEVATCSSSLRYKTDVDNFLPGLDLVRRLRPVRFKWIDGGMLDVGLIAEEVAAAEPLLTTKNKAGEVEGVKYDRVGVVLINAVKEQQDEIEDLKEKGKRRKAKNEEQNKEIKRLRAEVDTLKAIVCELKPEAAFCKQTEN